MNIRPETRLRAALASAVMCLTVVAHGAPALAGAKTTAANLLNPDAVSEDWLTYNRNYAAHRYTPLDQIDKSNVSDLKVAFTFALGGNEAGGFWRQGNIESTPLVEDGIIYIANGWSQLTALDVRKSGQGPDMVKWIFDPSIDKDWAGSVSCCGISNRGVALWEDSVIMSTLDGRMIRINKDTGEQIWSTRVGDPAIAETITVAPLVVKDVAITGVSGGEFGIRGWLAAIDLNTGIEKWRRYTVPGPGEQGHETWTDDHDAWLTGGGSTWVTGSYDPDLDLVYWGVGNPGPDWDHEYRPGDNLYTNSTIALDPDTGEIAFHFQYTPNGSYDFDGVNEPVLIDAAIGGRDRKAFIHADRNGFFYAIDRTDGMFLYGTQYVDELNWTRGLDKSTGLPLDYDPNSDIQSYVSQNTPSRGNQEANYCPNMNGGKNWAPMSFSPNTGLVYIPTTESCNTIKNKPESPGEGGSYSPRNWFSGGFPDVTTAKKGDGSWVAGSLKAIDVRNGKIVAKVGTRYPLMSGILSTAGGLVFVAQIEGKLCAFDDQSLEELWCFNMNTLTDAPTISFAVDGKQYIAVATGGWGLVPHYYAPSTPGLEKIPSSNMLWVFSL